MNNSLKSAVNAIEQAPEGTNCDTLFEYCDANGLPYETVEAMVATPGLTDLGRIHVALNAQVPDADTEKTSQAEDDNNESWPAVGNPGASDNSDDAGRNTADNGEVPD